MTCLWWKIGNWPTSIYRKEWWKSESQRCNRLTTPHIILEASPMFFVSGLFLFLIHSLPIFRDTCGFSHEPLNAPVTAPHCRLSSGHEWSLGISCHAERWDGFTFCGLSIEIRSVDVGFLESIRVPEIHLDWTETVSSNRDIPTIPKGSRNRDWLIRV